MTTVFEQPILRRRLVGYRVAIVEDHALLAQSLRLALTAEGADVEVVDLCGSEHGRRCGSRLLEPTPQCGVA